MTKRKAEPKLKNETTWICPACDSTLHMKPAEFIEHAKTVHGLASDIRGNRKMTMHVDGRDYFSSAYEWTVGGFVFYQYITRIRAADDMMRYA